MTQNRRIALNVVAIYGWAVDVDGGGGLTAVEINGKIYGKGMNAARQISRRFGRTTGVQTRSAADYSITATISVVSGPLKAAENLRMTVSDEPRKYIDNTLSIFRSCNGNT